MESSPTLEDKSHSSSRESYRSPFGAKFALESERLNDGGDDGPSGCSGDSDSVGDGGSAIFTGLCPLWPLMVRMVTMRVGDKRLIWAATTKFSYEQLDFVGTIGLQDSNHGV